MWVRSWPFFFAILNGMIFLYTKNTPYVSETLGNISCVFSLHQNIVDVASIFSLSIPPFSYMILRGGASAILQLAHHMGSQMQSSISSVSSTAASGNISLGNTSLNTHSAHNEQAFKYSRNPSTSGESLHYTANDGSALSNFANNHMSIQQTPGTTHSQLTFALETHDSVSRQLSEESQIAYQKADMSLMSLQQTHSSLKQLSDTQSKICNNMTTMSFNQSNQQSLRKEEAFQNIQSFAQTLQERYGLSEQNAHKLSWGISMSIPLPILMSPSHTRSREQSSFDQSQIDSIQAESKSHNLQSSWATLHSTHEERSLNQNSSEQTSYHEDFRKHIDEIEQHMLNWQQSVTESQQLSKSAAIMHSISEHTNANQTDLFLNFVIQKHGMSMQKAAHELNHNISFRNQLIQDFIKEQVHLSQKKDGPETQD